MPCNIGNNRNVSGGSRGVSLVSTETPFQIDINKIIDLHQSTTVV